MYFLDRPKTDRITEEYLWDKKRPRIHMKKMWSPRDTGGMALPNVRLHNLSFEISRLTTHWEGTNPELSWVKIEWELVSLYKPLDVLSHGSTTNGHDYSSNPQVANSKAAWRKAHRMSCVSHLRQSYASIWHNAIQIGKKTVYWKQWLMKGICDVKALWSMYFLF